MGYVQFFQAANCIYKPCTEFDLLIHFIFIDWYIIAFNTLYRLYMGVLGQRKPVPVLVAKDSTVCKLLGISTRLLMFPQRVWV